MKCAIACQKAFNSLKEAQIYSGKLRVAITECDSIFESLNLSSFSANSANTYESQIQQLKDNVKQCWSVKH